jgi:hypothetical protein
MSEGVLRCKQVLLLLPQVLCKSLRPTMSRVRVCIVVELAGIGDVGRTGPYSATAGGIQQFGRAIAADEWRVWMLVNRPADGEAK